MRAGVGPILWLNVPLRIGQRTHNAAFRDSLIGTISLLPRICSDLHCCRKATLDFARQKAKLAPSYIEYSAFNVGRT